MEILEWIQDWYAGQCDGDWEHSYSLKIETLDNPGWSITIDIAYTELEGLSKEYELIENDEYDWHGYSIKDNVFNAAGDPSKLQFLLELFRELVLKKQAHTP